jgi:ribosome-binding factor A
MPKDFSRTLRIADQLQRELANLIRLEVKDPRVGMVTLTGVEVTPDYAHAKVFFTLLGTTAQQEAAQRALTHAAGFLRGQIGRRIKIHTTPELHFVFDESVERGARLSQLIDSAIASAPAPNPAAGDTEH